VLRFHQVALVLAGAMLTTNAARYLGRESAQGAVAPGRDADLVLLDADPLLDIRHARRIAGVVLRGRYFDRTAIDGLLAAVSARR
jgi:imidazolonepropionase-like amidohydrolase